MYDVNPNSPFLQRFLGALPDYLKNEEIKVLEVHDSNLTPYISLQIKDTDYIIVHEIESSKTRILEGEREILSEVTSPEMFAGFIADVLKKN